MSARSKLATARMAWKRFLNKYYPLVAIFIVTCAIAIFSAVLDHNERARSDAIMRSFERQGFTVVSVDVEAKTAIVKTTNGREVEVVVVHGGQDYSPGVFCLMRPDGTVQTEVSCIVQPH